MNDGPERKYRLLLTELLRRRAAGEVKTIDDEDEVNGRLEDLWLGMPSDACERVDADVKEMIGLMSLSPVGKVEFMRGRP